MIDQETAERYKRALEEIMDCGQIRVLPDGRRAWMDDPGFEEIDRIAATALGLRVIYVTEGRGE